MSTRALTHRKGGGEYVEKFQICLARIYAGKGTSYLIIYLFISFTGNFRRKKEQWKKRKRIPISEGKKRSLLFYFPRSS